MILFVFCIILLYILSFFRYSEVMEEFTKQKATTLKGLMAVLIVLHHLSYFTDYLSAVHSWGAPIVSMFFFISGYGLMKKMKKYDYYSDYFDDFISHRIVKSLLIPFLLAWTIYRILFFFQLPNIATECKELFIHGTTILPYSWFVFTILLFYFLFYFVGKLKSRYFEFIITGFILGYIILTSSVEFARSWYISAMGFPCGIIFAKHEKFIHRYLQGYRYYLALPLCLILIAVCVFLKNEIMFSASYFIMPFMIACLCAKVNIEKLYEYKPVQWLSGISYEIFLYQGVCMSLLRSKYIDIQSDILFIISTLGLTFLFSYCMNRFRVSCLQKVGRF